MPARLLSSLETQGINQLPWSFILLIEFSCVWLYNWGLHFLAGQKWWFSVSKISSHSLFSNLISPSSNTATVGQPFSCFEFLSPPLLPLCSSAPPSPYIFLTLHAYFAYEVYDQLIWLYKKAHLDFYWDLICKLNQGKLTSCWCWDVLIKNKRY